MITKYIFRIIKTIPLLRRQTIYVLMTVTDVLATDLQHKTGAALFYLHKWRLKPPQLLARNQMEEVKVRQSLPTCICSTKTKEKTNAY